jgi:hypothetical protein
MAILRRLTILALGLALLPAPQRADEAKSESETEKALRTVEHGSGLLVDVLSVRRDKDKKLLTVRWRYRNPTKKPIVVLQQSPPVKALGVTRPVDGFIRETYYLEGNRDDARKTYRHSIVKDTGRKYWATPLIGLDRVAVGPGRQVVFWAKFSLPVNEGATISLHLPGLEPIDGLSVARLASPSVPEAKDDPDAEKPLRTVEHDKGLLVDVLALERDEDRKLLTVRWRYRNPTKKTIVVLEQSPPATIKMLNANRPVVKFIRETYYLEGDKDKARNTYRHFVVKDTAGKYWATPLISPDRVAVKPGAKVVFWAKFSLPVNEGATISLHLPGLEPIDDLSIGNKADR